LHPPLKVERPPSFVESLSVKSATVAFLASSALMIESMPKILEQHVVLFLGGIEDFGTHHQSSKLQEVRIVIELLNLNCDSNK
jgi:hypothetical protein